uniref:Uncharacterized protein n=1 Tax=Glossina palpalis gambiensis TaxID=67801 RepID=A0A1B0BH29_9MUSC
MQRPDTVDFVNRDLQNFVDGSFVLLLKESKHLGRSLANVKDCDSDPFDATTHRDHALRPTENEIPYKVIHNASILNAVGCCGLQLYKFGDTVSIPYWDETWKPESLYEEIKFNRLHNMHNMLVWSLVRIPG